ncbi:MAG TPA: PqqD family protein [Bacteroidales bacterium]|nr:PqqD family protein [Bacteroidales bacterium]HBZ19674.1 PqqD family protein [Bacteroidales bacterium]
MTTLKTVYNHSPNIVTRKTGSEYVLVPVANNIADMNSVYTLNESGAFIWELIDGKRNAQEIINKLMEEYDIDRDSAEKDVLSFINDMSNYLIINI